jgi:hypothetical protein
LGNRIGKRRPGPPYGDVPHCFLEERHMKRALMVLSGLSVCASIALAQAPAGQPATPQSLIAEVQRLYAAVGTNATGAAEAFPEDKYTWQPTPDVRTWAQLVAHMTDDAYNNCAVISGMSATPPSVERGQPSPNGKTKADLVAVSKPPSRRATRRLPRSPWRICSIQPAVAATRPSSAS